MNDMFERTWGERVGAAPGDDYWPTVIGAVQRRHPDFVFIAEAYWDLEWALQQQGFDYCYDKRLYDRLVHDDAEAVRRHLMRRPRLPAAARPLRREPRRAARGASTFPPAQGARGRRGDADPDRARGSSTTASSRAAGCSLPVFLGRAPRRAARPRARRFYERLLGALRRPRLPRPASGSSCERSGWAGNDTLDAARRLVLGGAEGVAAGSSSSTSADAPRRARDVPLSVGRPARPGPGGSTTPSSDAAYERSGRRPAATGSTSRSIPGAGTCSRSGPPRATSPPGGTVSCRAASPTDDRRAPAARRGHRPRRGRPVRRQPLVRVGPVPAPSARGARSARTTARTATPGPRSRTTTPGRAPTAGTRTAWPASRTSATSCASRSRCGTGTTRSSRSGCSG